jgi:hypothetical protein
VRGALPLTAEAAYRMVASMARRHQRSRTGYS